MSTGPEVEVTGTPPGGSGIPAASVLVVCTGNVCRSPLIERVLREAADDAFGPGVLEIGSAGTGALVGQGMDERSAQVLRELGGDPTGFLARRLTPALVGQADLILTASREHRSAVVRMTPRALRSTFTLREFAVLVANDLPATLPSDPADRLRALTEHARSRRVVLSRVDPLDLDIVDPFRRTAAEYQQMRDQVAPALEQVTSILAGRP